MVKSAALLSLILLDQRWIQWDGYALVGFSPDKMPSTSSSGDIITYSLCIEESRITEKSQVSAMCLKIGMYRDGQKHMSYVGCGNSPLRSGGGITQPRIFFFRRSLQEYHFKASIGACLLRCPDVSPHRHDGYQEYGGEGDAPTFRLDSIGWTNRILLRKLKYFICCLIYFFHSQQDISQTAYTRILPLSV